MKGISIKHPDADRDWGHGITVSDLEKISIKGLKGTEKLYWQYCNIYKVNPGLLMSITRKETGGDSRRLTEDNNFGGIKGSGNAGSRSGHAKYSCQEEGVRAHVSLISRVYVSKGCKTLEQIQAKYNPSNSGNWLGDVRSFYAKTGKSYSAAVAGSGVAKEILSPIDKETGQGGGQNFSSAIKKDLVPSSLENVTYWKKKTGNNWIVIHNTGGFDTARSCADYFHGGCVKEGRNVSAHYCVDEKDIIQVLEDSWKGAHAGTPKKGQYGADRGASNSNSIGIEIADGAKCDKEKAMNVGIELARYLVKKYNVPYDNVIRHHDVSGKECPQWIMNNNKWEYFKSEVKRRNDENIPLSFDTSGDGVAQGPNSFDNREDWTNIQEVKGVILNFIPPMNLTSSANKGDYFKKYDYDREYHYMVDSSQWLPEKETNLIAFSMQDNDKHTYIDRALFGNKAPKFTLSVGIFCSPQLEDYTITEKNMIDNVARVLHENNLNPNNLWREFDLNRAASPLMYLDRIQWKKLLKEIDKMYKWYAEEQASGKPKPEIVPTMTHEQYLEYLTYGDPKLIDIYAEAQEPYDKGLDEIINAPVTNDDRLNTLTKTLDTDNENTLFYNVVESSPGGSDHCVKPTSELNVLYKPDKVKVDPVYPDLIIPPNYSSTEHNVNDKNRVPLKKYEEFAIDDEDNFTKEFAFDFDLLKEMNKRSKGKPVNYDDPYPYDDKVVELERHHPKVKIDEWESRVYDCNHPGCPIGQPLAKNLASIVDAEISQSKKVEQRLVRIENTLSLVLRNLGRMASRVQINCVYYGGQDVFGKYKTIRCLRDDRINDGCSVTIDQCVSCTRYEPIIGQIYEILDETGMNGSTLLDDMQMAYMDLEEMKHLNRVEERSTKYKYADVNKDPKEAPKSMIDDWKAEDKKKYEEQLKKTVTDPKELEEKMKAIKEEDYVFRMDWTEKELELQQADVKPYPLEGIKAKYKINELGDPGEDSKIPADGKDQDKKDKGHDLSETPSPDREAEIDKEFKKDKENYDKLVNGEWTDTREDADTYEINKYSSENFFFEDFALDNSISGGEPGSAWGVEARGKILEMANKIVEDCNNGLAWYEMVPPRTVRYDQPVSRTVASKGKAQVIYDCSSFVSCCYFNAGLNSVYNLTNYDQYKATRDGGGEVWLANAEGVSKAQPGDLIWKADHAVSDPKKVSKSSHVMVYIGDNKIAHAANSKDGIKINEMNYILKSNQYVFGRPKDLMQADETASSNGSGGQPMSGTMKKKDGSSINVVWKFPKAILTGYTDIGSFATSSETGIYATAGNRSARKYCASHNIPMGTKIYIPEYDGVMGENKSGIFTVVDSGGPFFDFDLYVPNENEVGKVNKDVYVVEWGKLKHPAISFTYWLTKYSDGQWNKYKGGWRTYKQMNGVMVNFHKFLQEDANIKSHPRYNG